MSVNEISIHRPQNEADEIKRIHFQGKAFDILTVKNLEYLGQKSNSGDDSRDITEKFYW